MPETASPALDGLRRGDLTRSQLGSDAGHVLAQDVEPAGVVELPGDVLEAEVEQLLLGVLERLEQAVVVEVAVGGGVGH